MNISIKVNVFISLGRDHINLLEVFGCYNIHLLGISGKHLCIGKRLGWSELKRGLSRHMDHFLLLSELFLVQLLLFLIQDLFLMLQHL